jgi:serine/threonine-protein kinase RsbW
VGEPETLTLGVDARCLAAVRQAVSEFASRAGLGGRALADFVLAVNEIITNAIRHGGGRGRVRLWRGTWEHGSTELCCEVSDNGPGLTAPARPDPPPALATGGRGMWLARRLVDSVTITSGDHGTTVRLVKQMS